MADREFKHVKVAATITLTAEEVERQAKLVNMTVKEFMEKLANGL